MDEMSAGRRDYRPIRLDEKFAAFREHWSPRVIAEMNDYQFKLVRIQGEFVWHQHADTDEVFIVIAGSMSIAFRDGSVDLSAGDLYVVPRGVEHKPYAAEECQMMLIEPRGVVNTGEAGGALTASNDVWV
jgi:mannose-6-phosphate isomerase-like protein (cupin superfamily)